MSSNSLYYIPLPHNQFHLFSMLFQPFQTAGHTIVVLRQWFWAILANFHPYWCLVGGTMTTWGTPYRVITLSQCNTWILEPILKCTCVTKVDNSGNIHFLAYCKIFHTLYVLRGGFEHHPQGPILGHIS